MSDSTTGNMSPCTSSNTTADRLMECIIKKIQKIIDPIKSKDYCYNISSKRILDPT